MQYEYIYISLHTAWTGKGCSRCKSNTGPLLTKHIRKQPLVQLALANMQFNLHSTLLSPKSTLCTTVSSLNMVLPSKVS